MLVLDLGKWMNKILIDWGIDPTVADDSYRRNEAVHPSETAPLEYVADEAQSVS